MMSRILIVEDDRDIASFIKRGLEAEGYACDIADNGALALGLAQSNTYQLVILDLSLPLLDGTDVLTKLRSTGIDVPVIVLTARTALKDRVRALEGGANDYMPKPFQFAELLARVRLRLQDSTTTSEEAEGVVLRRRNMARSPSRISCWICASTAFRSAISGKISPAASSAC